jgi:predicted transcriptional regulator
MKAAPVLLSIKPKFSDLIFDGKKTVELRRVIPSEISVNSKVIIYASNPEKSIVGTARICKIEKLNVTDLWNEISDLACVDFEFFKSYFFGKEYGYALFLKEAKRFPVSFSLSTLRDRLNFRPPQSFLYPSADLLNAIR